MPGDQPGQGQAPDAGAAPAPDMELARMTGNVPQLDRAARHLDYG